MDILLISYGDIDYDGRLRSLIALFSEMGRVHCITRGSLPCNTMSKVVNVSYREFVAESIRFASELKAFDWLVLDNRKATVPGLIIKRRLKPDITIQDCRELYLFKETKHISGKIGCVFEKAMAKRSDIVICANQERAQIMQAEYGLKYKPLTYENLRQLEYRSNEDKLQAAARIDPILHEGEYRIISTSGCSILRTNDILVKNVKKIKYKCRIYLVGDSTEEDINSIKKLIKDNDLKNIEIVNRLNQAELKYLISQCHIGIVNYGQYDTNNRLCASGKLYEFLYEGIPVVTTTNPPLYRICKDAQIGYADDDYFTGINEVLDNYDEYVRRVKNYSNVHTPDENNKKLLTELLKRIEDRENN